MAKTSPASSAVTTTEDSTSAHRRPPAERPDASIWGRPPSAPYWRTSSPRQRSTPAGEAYRDHDLIFDQPNGDPLHPERLTKRFAQLVATSGLRRVRLHDLRHGPASMLLATGTDIALVSKMLGHSSIALTADTYSHLSAGGGSGPPTQPTP